MSARAQGKLILALLKAHGSLTTSDFRQYADIMHPAGRIYELRKAGHDIASTMQWVSDGESLHRQAVYSLVPGGRGHG